MSQLLVLPGRITDSNGVIVPNARRYSYESGGLTPAPTYTTAALNVSHGAYVEADSAGLLPPIYLDPAISYRFKDKTAAGVDIPGADYDPVDAATAADITFEAADTGATTRTIEAKLRDIVNAADFGFATTNTGAQNATALTAAAASLPNGGIVNIGPGTYTLNTTTIPANIEIRGAGIDSTIIVQGTITQTGAAYFYGIFYAMSASYTTYVENITIRDLTIKATAGTFSEFKYLMAFSGVRNLLIERVKFQGFQGSAIVLGGNAQNTTPSGASDYRHNLNTTVRDCVFDGVNNENGNGISVVDCNGFLADNCTFTNCVKSTMPGPIDFEPNAFALYVLKNCSVTNCTFTGCGGTNGLIGIFVPAAVTAIPTGFNFAGNRGDSNTVANDYLVNINRVTSDADALMAVSISGHSGSGGVRPYSFLSCNGVVVGEDCVFEDYDAAALIGFTGGTDTASNVVDRAQMIRVGSAGGGSGFGTAIFNAVRVTFSGHYVDCGDNGTDAAALVFSSGASSYITIDGLTISTPTGLTNKGILVDGAHTLSPTTNRQNRAANDLAGLSNTFVATAPGQTLLASLTWDPGSLADGAGETSSGVTVTGAAFGDTVEVAAPYDLQGILLTGYVSAADTVKMRLQNETGGVIDLASGSYKITVTKALV